MSIPRVSCWQNSKKKSGLSFEGGFQKLLKISAKMNLARHERAGWLVGSIKMLCSIQVVQ